MGQLTPQFLFDLETNMKVISSQAYANLNRESLWSRFAKRIPSMKRKERLIWFLDSAQIRYVNRLGGERQFDDILSTTVEYESKAATAGLELRKPQLDDLDGDGVSLATHWARGIGEYAAYWPEKQVFSAVRNGGLSTSLGYDGQIFFSKAHPVNPFDTSVTFANDFTGAAASTPSTDPQDAQYPGALPIDESVTLDVAVANIGKAIAYIRGIKMPNMEDPRKLRVGFIAGPPRLSARLVQICNAEMIAQAATAGGGGANIEAVIRSFGFGQPLIVDELGASMPNGSDTTWYMGVEEVASDELGGLAYIDRAPFQMTTIGLLTDAELARSRTFQWQTDGRNVVTYGHPYKLFRFQQT